MKNIKVAFYSPPGGNTGYSALTGKQIFVNPTPYYLHGYFKVNYPQYKDQVKWMPSILYSMTSENLIKYLEENQTDILCVSIYLWNVRSIWKEIEAVKQYFGNAITIIVGGPSTDAVKQDWNLKYPFVDHWVVGQGEKAWANLVLNFLGVTSLTTHETNIVHFVKNSNVQLQSQKIYNYEFIRGIHFSPYRECEDMIVEFIEFYKNKNMSLAWVYETSRGCPYHCTFCDWNGGQTNKTQKRKINFLDDIDFMAKHGMYDIYLADANFGMWEDDLAITKKVIEHNSQGHKFKYYLYNLNKNLNDWTKEIFELIIKHNLSTWWIKLSAQDVNQTVLDAIDRPGNWITYKNFAHTMYEKYNKSHNLNKIYVEIIVGLPGQTLKSFQDSLDEIYSNGFIPRCYPFQILPNAPVGYDQEYRKKYEIRSDEVFDVIDFVVKDQSIIEIFNKRDPNIVSEMIVSTSTASEQDIALMFVIDHLYRVLMSRPNMASWGFINTNWYHLKKLISRLMNTQDFNLISDTRVKNFLKYRINAMDSAEGKILNKGADMHCLVSRNWNIVEEEMMECPDREKFFSEWEKFNYAKDFLNF